MLSNVQLPPESGVDAVCSIAAFKALPRSREAAATEKEKEEGRRFAALHKTMGSREHADELATYPNQHTSNVRELSAASSSCIYQDPAPSARSALSGTCRSEVCRIASQLPLRSSLSAAPSNQSESPRRLPVANLHTFHESIRGGSPPCGIELAASYQNDRGLKTLGHPFGGGRGSGSANTAEYPNWQSGPGNGEQTSPSKLKTQMRPCIPDVGKGALPQPALVSSGQTQSSKAPSGQVSQVRPSVTPPPPPPLPGNALKANATSLVGGLAINVRRPAQQCQIPQSLAQSRAQKENVSAAVSYPLYRARHYLFAVSRQTRLNLAVPNFQTALS